MLLFSPHLRLNLVELKADAYLQGATVGFAASQTGGDAVAADAVEPGCIKYPTLKFRTDAD